MWQKSFRQAKQTQSKKFLLIKFMIENEKKSFFFWFNSMQKAIRFKIFVKFSSLGVYWVQKEQLLGNNKMEFLLYFYFILKEKHFYCFIDFFVKNVFFTCFGDSESTKNITKMNVFGIW